MIRGADANVNPNPNPNASYMNSVVNIDQVEFGYTGIQDSAIGDPGRTGERPEYVVGRISMKKTDRDKGFMRSMLMVKEKMRRLKGN